MLRLGREHYETNEEQEGRVSDEEERNETTRPTLNSQDQRRPDLLRQPRKVLVVPSLDKSQFSPIMRIQSASLLSPFHIVRRPTLPPSAQLCKTHRHDRVENARLDPLLLLHLQFLLPPAPPLVAASRAPSLILVVVAFLVGRSRRCRRRRAVRGFVPAYAEPRVSEETRGNQLVGFEVQRRGR